jgi:uncharacterized membrane protein YidH (DUF202 family)
LYLIAKIKYYLGEQMPRKIESAGKEEWHKHKGKFLISLGVLVFVIGLLRYYEFSWPVILMVAGILILLKGLYLKMK